MNELEINMRLEDDQWVVQIYNPRYGSVVLEREEKFETAAEARCWLETVSTITKDYDNVFYGKITEADIEYAEKLMNFRYADVA